jgi:hypothetical protein
MTMMPTLGRSGRQYGLSTNLFISPKENDQTLVLGGTGQEAQRWTHIITRRAAHVMWFKLTILLYPEKANMVTSLASTAPLRAPGSPAITTHIEVVRSAEAQYTLIGWMYPVGWEGRETKPKQLN